MAQDKERSGVQPVGRDSKPVELELETQQLIKQEELLSKKIEQEKGEKKQVDPEALLQLSRNLPRLIQKNLQRLEGSQVYQTFKLAGTEYIVHDRRESSKEKAKPELESEQKVIAEEAKKPLEELVLQKGKMVASKEKDYANYFADPSGRIKTPEQQAATERLVKLFSRFEKALLKRFEGGEEMTRQAEEGRFSFLKKTAQGWRDFFSHFAKRTVKRNISMEAVQEFIFRGLVRKDSKTTVISDLALVTGQLEKFARFRLNLSAMNLAERLNLLEPGTKLSASELKEGQGEKLEYLAIKSAESEASYAKAATKGKFFGTAQTEEKVANDLGLQLGAQLKEKEKILRNMRSKKKGGGLFGETQEEAPFDEEKNFIPWWQPGPLIRSKGPMRWFVAVSYLIILSLLVIGILYFL